jgi:hypothetical protein
MWVHCPRASNGLLPRRSNLVGYVRWDAQSDQFPPCQTIIPTAFRSQSGLPTNWTELTQSHPSFGLFKLRRLHQSCYCPRTGWRQVLSAGVTTTDVNRNSDSRNQCDTRRLAKCAIVSVPTHKAILPCVCLRSLTTKAGCGEPCTYKRALSPCTSIVSLVHSPGTTSA